MKAQTYSVQPVSFGNYLLLEKIGSGGMAEIYRAKSFGAHGFTKEYAVKKMLPNLIEDGEVVGRFVHEGLIGASLQHSNIVQVLDLGEIGRTSYIAMEYVHGKDLHELLARCARRRLRIPLKLILYIATSALKGLDFAHRAQDASGEPLRLVHSDVSPANILLGYVGDVKIGDFGVARRENTPLQQDELLQGKASYMSPEQVLGDLTDRRSDLYSMGIVLYEMLTRQRLFKGGNDLDVMLKIRDGQVDEELARLEPYPRQLRRIVERALARRVTDRYQTAAEFLADLQDFAFTHRILYTDEHLSRYLRRVFSDDYKRLNRVRKSDPDEPSKFPDLLSPQVARFRFREPNGNIVGPMSVETLVSILKYRKGTGLAVSVAYGPWLRPFEIPEIQQAMQANQEVVESADPLSRSVGFVSSDSQEDLDEEVEAAMPPPAAVSRARGTRAEPDNELSLKGDLGDIPFASLLYRLYVVRATGVLKITDGEIEKAINLEEGAPGYVASNRPGELLGNFLVDKSVISEAQLEEALERMSEFGGRLGDVLIKEGMLHRNELFHYLSLQAREKLMEVFSWSGGAFSYRDGLSPDRESYPLGIDTLEIIVEGIRSRMPLDAIQAVFASRMTAPLRILRNRQISLDRLRLTGTELGIAALFRDGDTVEEILRLVAMSRDGSDEDALRVLFLLYATRHLYFHQPDD